MKRPVFSITCALALTAVVVAAGIAVAAQDTKIFGSGGPNIKPFCEKSRAYGTCQVVGSLTTFINRFDGKKHPFVAPSDGRIVAWAVRLGHKPSKRAPKGNPDGKSNLEFFQDTFGNDKWGKGPVARLAILKRQGGVEFKLVDQSPAVKLSSSYYRRDTVITLERPMPIKEGEIVGLSSLTWIPMIKPHKAGDGKNSWRASIQKGNCDEDGILGAKPQKKVGSVRDYGCEFSDRLFYKAYFVRD